MSIEATTRLQSVLQLSHALSVEVWITPANVTQDGPARIVTMSNGATERNFTLGQGAFGSALANVYDFRLRTAHGSISDNGEPSLTTNTGTASASLTHLVYRRNREGSSQIYVNGMERASRLIAGELSNWDATYRLGLANEFGSQRPWTGHLHQVAIYSCVLSDADIAANWAAGPEATVGTTPLPPPRGDSFWLSCPN